MTDPFPTAHSDLVQLLSTTRPLLNSYLRIRSTASSPTSPELLEAKRELESALSDISADLSDLVASVEAAERDPYRFGLDVEEVSRRRNMVRDVEGEVERMRGEAQRVQQKSGTGAGQEGAGGKKTNVGLPDPTLFDADVDDDPDVDFEAEYERDRQQELLAEQDQQLDGVFRTVGNLRLQADTMGRELEEQGELLDSLDTTADRVGGKLQTGLKRVGDIARRNEDTWSSCCIGLLIVVLIILLVLVLVI